VVRDDVDRSVGGNPVVVHRGSMNPQARHVVPICLAPTPRCAMICQWMPPIARSSATSRRNGRLPNAALAERVHLSPSPCLRRLKRLEDEGTIRGYRAILDRRKVGLGLTVFVEVKVSAHSERRAREFEDAIAAVQEVVGCHIVAGMADFLLEVVVPDLAAYEQLLLHTLLELPGVTDARSNIAIRTIKEAGQLPLPTP
jgi:Lrp/AsnC family transcriptional regulator, leucine-responsive regulatory protein